MPDTAGDVKNGPAHDPLEAERRREPSEDPSVRPSGSETPGGADTGSPNDGDAKPGKATERKDNNAAADKDAQEAAERVLSPRELAASIQERSQMRRSGLDSLEGTAFFGDRTNFGGPASMSGPAAGRDVNIYVGSSLRATLPTGAVGRGRLRQVRDVHVAGANYSKGITVLSEEHLLVLVGANGSGRRMTALHMLTQLTDDQVHVIDAHITHAIVDETILSDGLGYLVEIPTRSDTWELTHAYLAALATTLQQRNAHLILIASHELPIDAEGVSRFVADHASPDCQEVLRRHIRQDAHRAQLAEQMLDAPQIQNACKSIRSPGSAAELAAKILEIAGTKGSVEEVLLFLDRVRRQQVRQILHRDASENRRSRVEALCRGALLVSLAVFADMSYVDATTAAESLAGRFITTELAGHGREIFLTRREYLLSQMDFALIDGHVTRRWGTAATQRVKFRDPALRVAVLEELWHEYDRSMLLLLDWLQDLSVTAPAPEVRVRSAQVIGTLAVREFAYFCDQVLLSWAASANALAREAAATALETVAIAGNIRQQINELLTEWCQDGNLRMQQTAVLAMGTRISESAVPETLANLRSLALRSNGKNSEPMREAVRQAISELYSGPDKRQVVLTLASWVTSTDPATRRLARQCMAPLIHFTDTSGRSSLLMACADVPNLAAPISTVIASLLDKPEAPDEMTTQRDMWNTFESWVSSADGHPELMVPLTGLLDRLRAKNAGLDGQLRFYLSLWAFRHSDRTRTSLSEETS